VKGLAGLKVQRRPEVKLGEPDDRLRGCGRNRDPGYLSGRPYAQAVALGLQSIEQREVEAVQLDAGVKAFFEGGDDAGAYKRLGMAIEQRDTGSSQC